jgi:hypothetical protein
MLLQITAPHFCAGVDLENNKVIAYAPIVKYMKGWTENKIRNYCKSKKWDVKEVDVSK